RRALDEEGDVAAVALEPHLVVAEQREALAAGGERRAALDRRELLELLERVDSEELGGRSLGPGREGIEPRDVLGQRLLGCAPERLEVGRAVTEVVAVEGERPSDEIAER